MLSCITKHLCIFVSVCYYSSKVQLNQKREEENNNIFMVFQHCFHKQFLCKINMLKDVQEVKLWAMVLLGSISMILGMLPLKLGPKYFKTGTKSGWRNVVTSLLLCFGGGVLLATSLIHMLPEVKLRFIFDFLKF